MQQRHNTLADLFAYVSDFYKAVDTKLNYLTRSVTVLRNHMTRLYGLQNNVTDLPPATGHLKLKQDGCLQLLCMIDAVLRQAGIQYFLSYGTLLGAARTGKFIPWDDDIDICLMRDDFNRAVSVLQKKFNHGKFFTTWGVSGGIFKVMFTPHICVDLFPWDSYYKKIETPDEENQFVTDYIYAMQCARQMESDKKTLESNPNAIVQTSWNTYTEIRDEIIMHNQRPDTTTGDIFEGIDWQTYPERMAHFFHSKPFRREWIFPLGQIEFCGHKFPAPNNVDAVLTTRFGDWNEFKPEFSRHNNDTFSYDELPFVHELISGNIK